MVSIQGAACKLDELRQAVQETFQELVEHDKQKLTRSLPHKRSQRPCLTEVHIENPANATELRRAARELQKRSSNAIINRQQLSRTSTARSDDAPTRSTPSLPARGAPVYSQQSSSLHVSNDWHQRGAPDTSIDIGLLRNIEFAQYNPSVGSYGQMGPLRQSLSTVDNATGPPPDSVRSIPRLPHETRDFGEDLRGSMGGAPAYSRMSTREDNESTFETEDSRMNSRDNVEALIPATDVNQQPGIKVTTWQSPRPVVRDEARRSLSQPLLSGAPSPSCPPCYTLEHPMVRRASTGPDGTGLPNGSEVPGSVALPAFNGEEVSSLAVEISHGLSDRVIVADEVPEYREVRVDPIVPTDRVYFGDIAGLKEIGFQWIHCLLIVLPLCLGPSLLDHCPWSFSPATVFFLNLVGLMPLSQFLADATEQVAIGLNSAALGALLNATLGNATEMIVTVTSLQAGLYGVVKSAMLGSILSNLLAVLGLTIMSGASKSRTVEFGMSGPVFSVSLLLLGSMSFALPTLCFYQSDLGQEKVVSISRALSLVSAITYGAYVFSQILETEDDEDEEPLLRMRTALPLLALATYLIGMLSDNLVDSISGLTKTTPMSAQFIGVVLLPLAGNVQGALQGVALARKGGTNIAIALALSGCTQVALLVLPFAVLAGWVLGKPMDLKFDLMDVAIMILSVLVAFSIMVSGRASWLHGLLLVSTYCTLTILFWSI